jgi:hypothetical protein
MVEEPNIYAYLVSMLALCVFLGLLAGIYAKFISVMTGTLAYPTYLALYGMEFALAPGRKKKRCFSDSIYLRRGRIGNSAIGLPQWLRCYYFFPWDGHFGCPSHPRLN